MDVLSVGDIATDAFVRLLDDQAFSYSNQYGKWLAVPFGSKIPYEHTEIIHATGNAANAAVAFARLGLKSGLVTNIGGDEAGRQMIHALQAEGIDHRYVKVNPDKSSNYHYVLWYKEERTILIKHEDYNYFWPSIEASLLPKWLYFSSISENALAYHDQLETFLESNPSVKLAFQPGTFQMKIGVDRLKGIYKRTEILALNRDEAVILTGGDKSDINGLISKLHELGPRIIVISDGHDGAYASDGKTRYKMPIYPDPAPPFERTGAGDAFTATFVAAIIKGQTVEGALQWAPINSMSVVQKTGSQAGLLNEEQIEDYLSKAPADYQVSQF